MNPSHNNDNLTFEAGSCKNFKAVFLKTLFFKSSTSNAYISESVALRRLGQVSIDPKFYLVLGSGHNSIPQKWDLFRWMYAMVSKFSQRSFHQNQEKTNSLTTLPEGLRSLARIHFCLKI